MSEKIEIDVNRYFQVKTNEYGHSQYIMIGNDKELCAEIKKQNVRLQAKEQECEKVKNWVKGMMFYTDCSNWFERFTTAFEDWKNDLTRQLDQLKAEKEILKEKLVISSNSDKKTLKIIQTLTDIKEMLKEICMEECSFDLNKTSKKYCGDYDCRYGQILQKISECEVK